jgi:hypothetical protein
MNSLSVRVAIAPRGGQAAFAHKLLRASPPNQAHKTLMAYAGISYNLLLLKRFPNAAARLDRQSIVPLPTLLAFIEHLP